MTSLAGKRVMIFGSTGAVGMAAAVAFAREGAALHLFARTHATLEAQKSELKSDGAVADAHVLDVTDEAATHRVIAKIVASDGPPDIIWNLMGTGDAQGHKLRDMTTSHFLLPIALAMRGHFNTAAACVPHMRAGSVILALTASPARNPHPDAGGFGVACAAIEALMRQHAVELGPLGIRAVTLRSAGSPDTPGVSAAMEIHAANAGLSREEFETRSTAHVPLRRMPLLAEIANAAILAASPLGTAWTGGVMNVTCGALLD